jgi:hypothetical protein
MTTITIEKLDELEALALAAAAKRAAWVSYPLMAGLFKQGGV